MSLTVYDSDGNLLKSLYQWDANQTIMVTGITIPPSPVFHFCNRRSKEALVVTPSIDSSFLVVDIPNILLQQAEPIIAYLYVETEADSYRTTHAIHIPVIPRPMPNDYEFNENVNYTSVAILNSRLNALIQRITTDSSSSDAARWAELIDIRTAYDGSMYDTAGEAVRALGQEVNELLGTTNTRIKTSIRYSGKRINPSLAIGDTFSMVDYTYSNLHEIPVHAAVKGVYVETQISTSTGWFPWVVVDANDKVLALGPIRSDAGSGEGPHSAGDYIDLTGLANPARIIVRQTSTAAYSVAYFDFDRDKHVIYPGDIIPVTVTGASAVGSTEKGMPVYQYSGNGSITLTAGADVEARTFGVWLKVPDYDDTLMMTRLTVTGYKDSTASTAVNDVIDTYSPLANVFRMGEWVFVKVTTKDKPFNKVTIYPTIQSGSQHSISLLVLGGIVADHFARPITVFDMDGTWTATEACGAYDLLIDNGVPWTITGSISVTDEIKTKMIGAYKKGILDIGSYGAEIENNTLDVNASYGTLISRAYSVLEAKLADCCLPTSFGPGNHYASPRLWRALKEAGYTAIKGGATAVARGTVSCDDGGVLFLCGDPKYAMSVGGTTLKFYHGISNDPSAESQPSMYTSKAAFGEHVNTAMMFRSSGGMLILNMKQYAEYMEGKKHD